MEGQTEIKKKESVSASGVIETSTLRHNKLKNTTTAEDVKRTSLYEVLALALFSTMSVAFTVAFTSLGIFYYHDGSYQFAFK